MADLHGTMADLHGAIENLHGAIAESARSDAESRAEVINRSSEANRIEIQRFLIKMLINKK